MLPPWLTVDLRPGPSANVLLVRGPDGRVLVDCGAGTRASDARLDAFAPDVDLLVATHWHADHVGGAARLQRERGVPVAGGAAEAELIAAHDPRAYDGAWLSLPVTP